MTKKRGVGRPNTGNIRTHVMLEPDLLERLTRRAEVEHRNVSNMINVLIRAALDSDMKEWGLTGSLERAGGK